MKGSTAAVRATASHWTQCYVSIGDPDGEDFAFTKCDADGTFTLRAFPMAIGELPSSTSGTISSWTAFRRPSPGPAAPSSIWETLPATPVADEPLYPDFHRRQQGWRLAIPTRPEFLLITINVRLPRRQPGEQSHHRLERYRQLQRDVPAVQLVCGRNGYYPLQEHRDPRGLRRGRARRRTPSCGATGYPPCGTSTIGKFLANTVEQVPLPTNLRYRARSIAPTRTAPALDSDCGPAIAQRSPSTGTTCRPAFHRPHRSAVGCDRGLARLLLARTTSSNSARRPTRRRKRRHPGPRRLCLHASV